MLEANLRIPAYRNVNYTGQTVKWGRVGVFSYVCNMGSQIQAGALSRPGLSLLLGC